MTWPHSEQLQALLAEIDTHSSPLSWVTPINTEAVAADLALAVEAGHDHISRWSYPDFDAAPVNTAIRAGLELVRDVDEWWGEPARSYFELRKAETEAIAARNDDSFTRWSLAAHGTPTSAMVAEAQNLASSAPTTPAIHPASEGDLRRGLTLALANYGISHWKIVVSEHMAAKMAVNKERLEVKIKANQSWDRGAINRLIVHEIGGHVLRTENSWAQPTPWAARPLDNAMPTEEGLAVVIEERLGVSSAAQLRTYAIRTIAVDLARCHGAVKVTRALTKFLNLQEAARLAIRVKRGLLDPNQPGGFTKDHAYFTGSAEVRAAFADDPDLLHALHATKWPLARLPLARELIDADVLRPAMLLPDLKILGVLE